MYTERRSSIPGAFVWTRTDDRTAADPPGRVLPDGCMDLIWHDGRILVAGPDTTAQLVAATGSWTGLRFAPGTAPSALGVPAYVLRDQRVWLDELWSAREADEVTDVVGASADVGAALESFGAARLQDGGRDDGWTAAATRRLRAGASVAAVAGSVGFSERQLHRRSLAAYGYGLKMLGRVLRMNRALDLATLGLPLADVSIEAGYADQPHLAREVRALAGVPISRLVAR